MAFAEDGADLFERRKWALRTIIADEREMRILRVRSGVAVGC